MVDVCDMWSGMDPVFMVIGGCQDNYVVWNGYLCGPSGNGLRVWDGVAYL